MNVNKIILAGRITRDLQLSYTPSQVAVVEFGLAVNKKYKDKERVCFVDIRAFGKQAETLHKYLSKGDPLYMCGELQFDSWTAQDGTKRSKHRVTVEEFQFVGGERQAAGNNAGQDRSQQSNYPAPYGEGGEGDIPF